MDRNGGHLEIVIGTSAGNVHVIETEGGVKDRAGFPYSMGIIHGQVSCSITSCYVHLKVLCIF